MNKAIIPVCLITILTLICCYVIAKEYTEKTNISSGQGNVASKEEENITLEGSGNTLTGVILKVDTKDSVISFKDIISEKKYELEYIGATAFYNKYGDGIVPKELKCGQIADVSYTIHGDTIKSVRLSDKVWEMTDVRKFSVDEKKKIFKIGDDSYKFGNGIEIFSYGEKAEWMDLTDLDSITVRGLDKKILSIVIDKGHGYLRLKNDSYFVGGYIEVGNDLIRPITDDMLLPVPEGDFHIRLTNKGYLAQKDVSVIRDRETLIDLRDVVIEEIAVCHVEFNISPVYAQLYIDGEMTDYVDRVPLEYGVHSVRVEAAGYEPVTTNIKTGSEYANVDITLDMAQPDDSDTTGNTGKTGDTQRPGSTTGQTDTSSTGYSDTSSDPNRPYPGTASDTSRSTTSTTAAVPAVSDTSGTSQTSRTSSTVSDSSTETTDIISSVKKIYVQQPEGCEVYLDGAYIGIAPASTTKVTGNHVITLSKNGCQTKTYTVNIENDGKDITFSFSALLEE
ncbi:MAG: PEGA domain-containing protein [Lachnospiraceae bacterium]|nr:PEGA domain-containing protein [Lachnospiraceae bacterium]